MSKQINTIYLGYACRPPFVIYGTRELTLKKPISEKLALFKAEKAQFTLEDFEENLNITF